MNSLGVYIQIPFCAAKCTFCNFRTWVARPGDIDRYGQALYKEITTLSQSYRAQGISPPLFDLPVDSFYLGGGNPALLAWSAWEELLRLVGAKFQPSAPLEFTVEITPGTGDSAGLEALRAFGVNRLSVGAQSFIERELRAVGRLHSADGTRQLIQAARAAGFSNISLDLVAGLPYQTVESWQQSLTEAVRLQPEHLSIYLLELDEKSRLGREALQGGRRYHVQALPGEEFLLEAYVTAKDYLAKFGYQQYEISNFALPGYESRHNQKYWRLEPYLGLGAGAHSYDGTRRWANEAEPEAYGKRLASGDSPIVEVHKLTSEQQIEEFFFLGLRERRGVNLLTARARWGAELVTRWQVVIDRLCQEGWLERAAGWVRLTDQALLISNEVFQQFLLDPGEKPAPAPAGAFKEQAREKGSEL